MKKTSLLRLGTMAVAVCLTLAFALPVQAASSNSRAMVACGNLYTLALNDDGTVWGWGGRFFGYGDYGFTPVQVKGLADIVSISAGGNSSAALKADGTVWVWGADNPQPVKNPYLTNIVSIDINGASGLALKSDGTVWTWGISNFNNPIPEKVPGLPEIKAIASGGNGSLALDKNGNVWQWDIGSGTAAPTKVAGLSNVTAIAANNQFVVLKSDGTVWEWDRLYTVVGNPSVTQAVKPLGRVGGLSDVIAVSAGADYSIAIKKDGTVWTWGRMSPSLGDGKTSTSETPVQVSGITSAVGISAGSGFAAILTSDGSVWTWGWNIAGQLGHEDSPSGGSDTSTNTSVPGQVIGADRKGFLNLLKPSGGDLTGNISSSSAAGGSGSNPDTGDNDILGMVSGLVVVSALCIGGIFAAGRIRRRIN